MVTLVSWKNFLKKKSLWTILSFDQSDKILFIRIDRSLISKVDMKIGEKPIRGRNFYLRERNIDRIDILFFFKLLYSLASYSIIEDIQLRYRFHETETRNGDAHFHVTLHFSRGEMEKFADSGHCFVVLLGKRRKRRMIFRVRSRVNRRETEEKFSRRPPPPLSASSRNYLARLAN